jgi:hypothetical protein
MQYVIDSTGHPDTSTIVVFFASDTPLETEARAVIAASLFRPAMSAGRPVRMLGKQMVVWK